MSTSANETAGQLERMSRRYTDFAHFFQLEIRKKKRDNLSEKRESGMALRKRESTHESGKVDTNADGAVKEEHG